MNTGVAQTFTENKPLPVHPLLKWPSVLLSYIFHPIFIPLYAVLFLVYIHPSYFSGFADSTKLRTIFIVIQNAIFYPLFCIALLKGVGFIDSIFLRSQKDRIIPYIACGIFFFWLFLVFQKQLMYPRILPSFILGIFLASSAALIANIYFKISMHSIGLGGWAGLFMVIAGTNTMLMTWPLAGVLLISGVVCTARLIVSNHTPRDIYTGFFLGAIAQFVAAYVIL
jgi:hypothetical protein